MSTSRPFAYNPSPNPLISGTTQVGDIAIGVNPNLDYFGGAGGVQWWQGPDEDLGYIVAKPIPPLTQPNPLNIPAGVAFGRSLFTEEAFILLAESLSSGITFTSGNDASTWLTSNGYWNTWVFITPTPTPTITQTPTPTPTITQTPTPTLDLFLASLVSCSNQGGSPTNEMYLPTLYYPYTTGPFSGWYATTVIDTLGDCYYAIGLSSPGALPQLTWGGTNTSSWLNYFNQGQYSGCTQCVSTPTPTITPTNTQTPTLSSTPGSTPTNTPTRTSTPAPTPAPQYYYMSPNSWSPPSIPQSVGNNFLITDETLDSTINFDGYYTDEDWSFSFWAYPQFQYTSLPAGTQISKFISIAVPSGTPPYPDNFEGNLTIGSEYTSGGTLVNDLVVWMSQSVGGGGTTYAKWTWSINGDNALITGINSAIMWDYDNYGTTNNPRRFTNITISFDSTLLDTSGSTSIKAYWNGIQLTLKNYTNSSIPHLGPEYTNMKLFLSEGGTMGNIANFALSTSLDAVSYYPLTILSQPNAATIYNGGVISPYALNVGIGTYTWNFDDVSSGHLQCLDNVNSNFPNFILVEYNPNTPNIITYPLV